VKQLADMVLELTGSTSKIEMHPLPTDDPRVRRPDITRAKTLLGWEPKVDVRTGLLRTIEYFKTRIGARVTG
jgi:nucleoside-diphosphate-sugar epimerase